MSDPQDEPVGLVFARLSVKHAERQPTADDRAEMADALANYRAIFGDEAVREVIEIALGLTVPPGGKPKSRRIAARNRARLAFYDAAIARDPALTVEDVAVMLSDDRQREGFAPDVDVDLGGNSADRIKNDLYALLKERARAAGLAAECEI